MEGVFPVLRFGFSVAGGSWVVLIAMVGMERQVCGSWAWTLWRFASRSNWRDCRVSSFPAARAPPWPSSRRRTSLSVHIPPSFRFFLSRFRIASRRFSFSCVPLLLFLLKRKLIAAETLLQFPALREFRSSGKPIWGTCAGLIFLADKAVGERRISTAAGLRN